MRAGRARGGGRVDRRGGGAPDVDAPDVAAPQENLWIAILIRTLCRLLPIPFVFLLVPHGSSLDRTERFELDALSPVEGEGEGEGEGDGKGGDIAVV